MIYPSSVIQRGFSGGELAPVLHARADHEKYTSGLAKCLNFLVLRHGAVANRPGFRFVAECKTNDANVRLLRYVSETQNESMLLEAGANYIRFYKNGARVLVSGVAAYNGATPYVPGDLVEEGGVNYYCIAETTGDTPPDAAFWYPLDGDIFEIPTTYTTAGLFNWTQSGNVIVLTHRLHDPRELICLGETSWVLRLADTVPGIDPPVGLALAPIAGAQVYSYIITAADSETGEESLPSTAATDAAIAAPTVVAPHALTWTAHAGAGYYNVYCDPTGNGVYGFIGTAAGNLFNNPGNVPDFAVTPPIDRTPFVSAETRPHVCTHYQQRRFYANAIAAPEGIEASRIGFPNNFGRSSPLQDDDGLTFRMVGLANHPVQHMIGLKQLIVLTDAGGWSVGEPKVPLTPSNIPADQEIYVGAAPDVAPIVAGNSLIYLQSRASIIRDVRFDIQVDGLGGRDLTLYASHLFDGHVIDRMDYSLTPHSIIWCVRDDGTLLGMTYVREEEVFGWHQHTTQGNFEQVCTVPEGREDVLYVVVQRTIDGNNVRYIERLESRDLDPDEFNETAFFVDSGLSYNGSPATVFSGLDHLEGESVRVVANGVDLGQFTVAAGSVTLPSAASDVHIGLSIPTPEIETLDLDAPGTDIRDRYKRVGSVTLLVDRSSRGFSIGQDRDSLTAYEESVFDAPGDDFTGQIEVTLESKFEKPGRVVVRQESALPITILGLLPNVAVGG